MVFRKAFVERLLLNAPHIPLKIGSEKSLIVMDSNINNNKDNLEKIIKIKNIVKKFNGNFILLWHNSSFNIPIWENGKYIYEEILRNLS